MSKEEEEYYRAVERKKVVLMWLCLFCKTICIAPALGEPAVSSTVLPGQCIPADAAAGWGLLGVHCCISVPDSSLCVLKAGRLCSR